MQLQCSHVAVAALQFQIITLDFLLVDNDKYTLHSKRERERVAMLSILLKHIPQKRSNVDNYNAISLDRYVVAFVFHFAVV